MPAPCSEPAARGAAAGRARRALAPLRVEIKRHAIDATCSVAYRRLFPPRCMYDPDANEAKPWRVQWKEGGEKMGTRKGRDDVRVKA